MKSFIRDTRVAAKEKEKLAQRQSSVAVFDKLLRLTDPDAREVSSSSSSGDSDLENADLLTPAKLIKHQRKFQAIIREHQKAR